MICAKVERSFLQVLNLVYSTPYVNWYFDTPCSFIHNIFESSLGLSIYRFFFSLRKHTFIAYLHFFLFRTINKEEIKRNSKYLLFHDFYVFILLISSCAYFFNSIHTYSLHTAVFHPSLALLSHIVDILRNTRE